MPRSSFSVSEEQARQAGVNWLPDPKDWLPYPFGHRTDSNSQHREFYVSNSGDDNNPGTKGKPWKSIDRVNKEHLVAGDSVHFHAGQKFTGNLVIDGLAKAPAGSNASLGDWLHWLAFPKDSINISTYGGSRRATIEAHDGTAILAKNTGNISVRNLELSGDRSTNSGFGVEVLNQTKSRLNNVWLDNLDAHGFKWVGLYVGGAPPLPGFHPQQRPERWGFNHVLISNSDAHDNTYYGVLTSGPWPYEIPPDGSHPKNPGYANADVRVINVNAHHNPGDPNYHENHSGSGILIDDTDGYLVEFSKEWHNGADNGSQSGGPVGVWANQANRGLIQFNESFDNRSGGLADGAGVDLDGGVTNSISQFNYTHDNDGAGQLVWNYWGSLRDLAHNTVRYNLSVNDARKFSYGGIQIGNSGQEVHDIDVYGNITYMTKSGNRPALASPTGLYIVGSNPNTNINYWNNVLITGKGVPQVEVTPNSSAWIRRNVFIHPPGALEIKYNGKIYHSLKDFENATKNVKP
ncbi:MAG TPA: hypothetical protein V6D22_08420 [Candidatus Obscuribacterales bacterium]